MVAGWFINNSEIKKFNKYWKMTSNKK
jgi:hypothetical protein